ncbi:hypothetical protein [uncultured Selenomonas sp.]|uniref:hypothetical protein n=1 Tax=uncultured Selenomonas sp. TaxID=159275 RepID=UPI00260073C4|nr:hypothetical protein [uncultured Selenomonas sp.]
MKKGVLKKLMIAAAVGMSSLMLAPSADAKMQFYKPAYGDKIQAKVTDGSTITFARTGGVSFTINGVPYYGDDAGARTDYLEMSVKAAKDDVTGDMVFYVTFEDPDGVVRDGWLFAKMKDGTFHDIRVNDSWSHRRQVELKPSKSGNPDTFSVLYENPGNPNKNIGIAVWWDKKLNRWNYHG